MFMMMKYEIIKDDIEEGDTFEDDVTSVMIMTELKRRFVQDRCGSFAQRWSPQGYMIVRRSWSLCKASACSWC